MVPHYAGLYGGILTTVSTFTDGGQGWSRTTVLGFSVRHTNRVCHLPIFVLLDAEEKIVGLEPTTHCLYTIALPYELNFF